MYELAKIGGYLLSPLTLAFFLGLLAVVAASLGRRGWAKAFAAVGFAGLWIASTPLAAQWLTLQLESRYPALTPASTPSADAVVVLGGALSAAIPPRRPNFNLSGAAGRVWHAAALYRAGKARWVIVAAGDRQVPEGFQTEAQAIGEMLQALGVPESAIQLDKTSRNTRENAAEVRSIGQRLGVRRVLLVTSAIHMPRAMRTFVRVWAGWPVQVVPAVADVSVGTENHGPFMWIPSAGALANVTSALKEYAGLLAVDMM